MHTHADVATHMWKVTVLCVLVPSVFRRLFVSGSENRGVSWECRKRAGSQGQRVDIPVIHVFFWLGVFTEWVGLLAYALISKWWPDLIRVVVQRGGGAGGRLAVTTVAGVGLKKLLVPNLASVWCPAVAWAGSCHKRAVLLL